MRKIFKIIFLFAAVFSTAQTSFNYERAWGTYLGAVDSNIDRVFFDNQNNLYLEGAVKNIQNNNPSPGISYYNQFVTSGMQGFTLGTINSFSSKITSTGNNVLSYGYSGVKKRIIHRELNGNYYQLESATTPLSTTGSVWLNNNVEPGINYILLSKYNSNNVLQWSTYSPFVNEVKTDNAGNVYISGSTLWQSLGDSGTAFPTFTFPNIPGEAIKSNIYVVKLNAQGQKIWATYLPSSTYTNFETLNNAVYVLTNGEINVSDTNMATTGTFQQTKAASAITKLNSTNGTREWGTYYGSSSGLESVIDKVAVDEDGIYIVGAVYDFSGNPGTYYSTPGAFQTQFAGGISDYFFAKFNSGGNRVWGTYYGTPTDEYFLGGFSNLSLSGNKILYTYLQDGTYNQATPGAYISTKPNSGSDIAFTMFNTNGNRIFTSYYGGALPLNNNMGWTVGGKFSDTEDAFYIYGSTTSQSGYYTPGAIQSSIIFPNANAIGMTSYIAKFILKTLATSETSLANDLQLFDNPNNGNFSLQGKILEKENCSFKLYDSSGRFIREENIKQQNRQDFKYQSQFPVGNYILSVFNSKNNLMKSFKMIVK